MFVIQTVIHDSQQGQSSGMRLWCCTWAADSQLNLSMCAGVLIPGRSTSCALTPLSLCSFFAFPLLKETVNKQGQHAWSFYRWCICVYVCVCVEPLLYRVMEIINDVLSNIIQMMSNFKILVKV